MEFGEPGELGELIGTARPSPPSVGIGHQPHEHLAPARAVELGEHEPLRSP
jgi:hypothetical protein